MKPLLSRLRAGCPGGRCVPAVVVVGGVLLSCLLAWALARHEARTREVALARRAGAVRTAVAMAVEQRLKAITYTARRWGQFAVEDRAEFTREARHHMREHRGFTTIVRAERDGALRWRVPADTAADSAAADAIARAGMRLAPLAEARRRGEAVLSASSAPLPDGTPAIVAAVPVGRGGDFSGYVVAVFRITDLLDAILEEQQRAGFRYWSGGIALVEDGRRVYTSSGAVPPSDRPHATAALAIGGAAWSLDVWPNDVWLSELSSRAPEIALGGGLLLSVMLGWALLAGQRARDRELALARNAAEAIRASVERFRTVQEASPDGFALHESVRDESGRIVDFRWVYLNPAAARLLRRTRAELEGRRLLVEMPQIAVEGRFDAYARLAVEGGVEEREFTYRHGDGELVLHATAVRVGDGFAVHFTDVTARRTAEEALRRSEERFRTVLDRSADLVAILAPDGTILYASPAYEHGLGHPPEALMGREMSAFLHPDDLEAARGALARLAAGAPSAELELRGRHADGHFLNFAIRATNLVADPHVGGIVVTGRDVTEQRRLEHHLRQAQKMEAIGRLAGGVAHDFNNLLTVIRSHAEFLKDALPAGSEPRDDVEEIAKAAMRAAGLTRQLLAFSRQQILTPQVVEPNAVIGELSRMLCRLIGEDIVLALRLAPSAGAVFVDPGQLEQVLMNLAVNARDAMPKGGSLTVATGARTLTPPEAEPLGVAPGDYVALSVTDTGVGIAEEVRARLFEPFFTTKAVGQGTGLGLATVYGIVTQSGGAIQVESAVGRGTTFTVLLPRHDGREAAPAATSSAAPAPPPATETILLVEDDDSVRDAMRRILARRGYTVLEAMHGRAALELLSGGARPVDLVVSDAIMPQLSGPDLLATIAVRWPGLPVLLVSGYTDDDLTRRGALPEGASFLHKPFAVDDLLRSVRAAIDGAPGSAVGAAAAVA